MVLQPGLEPATQFLEGLILRPPAVFGSDQFGPQQFEELVLGLQVPGQGLALKLTLSGRGGGISMELLERGQPSL